MSKRMIDKAADESGSVEKHHKPMFSDDDDDDPPSFAARSYQIEALEKGMKQNTIVYLETGSGKTLIAIMLIRSYACQLRKPSAFIAVFLVPTVHLVNQQAGAVITHTNLNVGKYWGELGVDFWDAHTWKNEIDKNEVLVMTPRILLDALRHGFFKLDIIKLLIFDECHNARGNSDYACILKEFYHPQLRTAPMHLPRIFGMTACLVKSKGATSPASYAKQILDFENLMNSKVFTVVNESVLAEFVPFSTPKVKLYKNVDISNYYSLILEPKLTNLKMMFVKTLNGASKNSAVKNISRLYEAFMYCLRDLGIWLAYEAAKSLSSSGTDIYFWEQRDDRIGEKIVKSFSKDVLGLISEHMPPGFKCFDGEKFKTNFDAGLLTSRVNCLIESLMEYRAMKDLRCIVFVERIITAVALQPLLSEIFQSVDWSVSYMAGNRQGLKSQKRNEQLDIIDAFRKGSVNIIVATQILEEGLDVQHCNLVIRFDLSKTVCSFIQSRGRARMEGSDYLLIVESGETSEVSRIKNYLSSGEIMREESLRHSSLPCIPPENDSSDEEYYLVENTGALISLNSSVSLLYYYCSQLPSDGYFKPTPRFIFDEDSKECTLYLPKSCPLQMVSVQGSKDILKKLVCLEACRKLHEIGALTDNLLPESVENKYNEYSGDLFFEEEQVKFFPGELVFQQLSHVEELYHCYSIAMKPSFDYDVPFQNIILAVKCDLGNDFKHLEFELAANRGTVNVNLVDVGTKLLNSEQVASGMKFQVTVLSLLIDRSMNKLADTIEKLLQNETVPRVHYLLLPSSSAISRPAIIDWDCVRSLCFPNIEVGSRGSTQKCDGSCSFVKNGTPFVQTKENVVCRCMLKNSLVFTPHNGRVYCITGFLDGLDGNSVMESSRNILTYKKHFKSQYGINLLHEGESLLRGRPMFSVQNCLRRNKCWNEKESINAYVELPPELCVIIMSRISLSTIYSFSFVPSIMHRVESILLALNFIKLQTDHCISNVHIPISKVLEAITTKKCEEEFCLESLETLGDSFLKYAVSRHLFRGNKHHHEGLLSIHKERLVSNNALCKLGCEHNVQGFIRHECFNPKQWIIPCDISKCPKLDEVSLPTLGQIYTVESRSVKSKVVADVVESLIGAYLITGGESAALICMDWLGLKVDFVNVITEERQFIIMHPEKHVDVNQLQTLLNYKFQDPSLLLEALTHGSYQLPEILRCYQRLEFLGDAVLDYLITIYMYSKYPGMSPGQLTDLRSSAVNNDCYAFAAVKSGLHKHILHMSSMLHEQIKSFVNSFEQLSLVSTFGWESETTVPKALGDIVESLAGAILVDSGYNKEVVWNCIRPILEPLVTPDTVKQHPVKELGELCQRESYENNIITSCVDGKASVTVEIKVNGVVICNDTRTGMNKKTAKKLAAKTVLESLKKTMANGS